MSPSIDALDQQRSSVIIFLSITHMETPVLCPKAAVHCRSSRLLENCRATAGVANLQETLILYIVPVNGIVEDPSKNV